MMKHALFVRLEAKSGKEKELTQFPHTGLELARQEGTTPVWCALQLGPSTFGIFDAFTDEAGRQAHLNGPIAQALGGERAQPAGAGTVDRTHRRARYQAALRAASRERLMVQSIAAKLTSI